MGALASLFGGGGGASAGGANSAGDATAGLTNSYQYNSAFLVGRDGSLSQTAKQDNGGTGSNPELLTWIAIGLSGIGLLLTVLHGRSAK